MRLRAASVAAVAVVATAAPVSSAFSPIVVPSSTSTVPVRTSVSASNGSNGDNSNNNGSRNPLSGVTDFFSNLDDIIDDFYNKRMGNGEIFYGKRKYNPSGNVEGNYNGFGLSDKQRIDDTREYREEKLEERRFRREMAELRREKERRWRDEYGE